MRALRTQGRLLHWCPAHPDLEYSEKAVPASHPNISARFVKETAHPKRVIFDVLNFELRIAHGLMDCYVLFSSMHMRAD